MLPQVIFGTSVILGLLLWSLVAAHYWQPWLRQRPRREALRPILLLHASRFAGLVFLVPGVVAADIPQAFAQPAAYGDLGAAVLALFALFTLRSGLGLVFAWLFSIEGSADLLFAFYQGYQTGLAPGQLGAAYFIPTLIVPLLLVTHALAFAILLRRDPT